MVWNEKIDSGCIFLRSLEEGDLSRTHEWLHRPELSEIMGVKVPFSMQSQMVWFDKLKNQDNKYVFAVCLQSSSEHIGNVSIDIDWVNRNGRLSIFLAGKSDRDRGLGTLAMRALISFAFDKLGLHRVWLKATADKPQLLRFYTKYGFRIEGRLVEHEFKGGRFVDKLIFGQLTTINNSTANA